MKIINRAKHLYSEEYIISESIKFEFNQMYLLIEDRWIECEQSTRSISFPDMLDSEGNKIFASLSEDGRGGDIVEFYDNGKYIKGAVYYENKFITYNGLHMSPHREEKLKVIGIQK